MIQHTIWRYDLTVEDLITVDMPEGAEILPHVQVSDRDAFAITLWAKVSPPEPQRPRKIAVIGTGNPVPAGMMDGPYIGSCNMHGLIWHVFEVKP